MGDEKKDGGKLVGVAGVGISKGGAKTNSSGEEKERGVGRDTLKKPGEGPADSSRNVTPAAAVDAPPGVDTAAATTDKEDDITKEKTTKPKEEKR